MFLQECFECTDASFAVGAVVVLGDRGKVCFKAVNFGAQHVCFRATGNVIFGVVHRVFSVVWSLVSLIGNCCNTVN